MRKLKLRLAANLATTEKAQIARERTAIKPTSCANKKNLNILSAVYIEEAKIGKWNDDQSREMTQVFFPFFLFSFLSTETQTGKLWTVCSSTFL